MMFKVNYLLLNLIALAAAGPFPGENGYGSCTPTTVTIPVTTYGTAKTVTETKTYSVTVTETKAGYPVTVTETKTYPVTVTGPGETKTSTVTVTKSAQGYPTTVTATITLPPKTITETKCPYATTTSNHY